MRQTIRVLRSHRSCYGTLSKNRLDSVLPLPDAIVRVELQHPQVASADDSSRDHGAQLLDAGEDPAREGKAIRHEVVLAYNRPRCIGFGVSASQAPMPRVAVRSL